MPNLEELKQVVCSTLPGLSEETLKKLVDGVVAVGVETQADLQFVKEEDLLEHLKPIQCRRLLNAWKCEEHASCSTPCRSAQPTLSDVSSPSSWSLSSSPLHSPCTTSPPSPAVPSASCTWAESFKVPWEVMPSGIRLAIANKKRPSPGDRRQLIRMVVDAMRRYELSPTRAQCQIVAQNIVKQYPESFSDVLHDGMIVGSGHGSNAVPPSSLSSLKSSWPYLFCLKGLSIHFQLLTDIPLLPRIMEGFEVKGKRILRFFEEKPTNDEVRAILLKSGQESSLVPCILLLLMAHFKEKSESLLLEADVAATAADVQRTVALPDSPRLIIQGDKMNPERWMLSVEGEIVLGSNSNTFVEGLAALFATYYTFNLEYQEGAASTLEFIQRGIVGINPGTGSKVGAGKREKKRSGMNPHVCTLLRKLMDFEWLCL
ncbi:uncharacterized protein LOC118800543 [Colossoma macropomum]|uniref:uncharacterized protein LOC118800543 n=1 Tax=Colossoma macropomum TaxID=42526 RepID=UPI0018648A38|nr:uncharacterized protein LOC118800543 [Colossoma macropomum]